MRLETALFASREGLSAHGSAIAVIGDNISNANTTAYKTSRVEFGDLLPEGGDGRQSTTEAGSGSGVVIERVRQIHDVGIIEFTGRDLDVGIAGNGYFLVGDAETPRYTRAGNFAVNGEGFLVTAEGENVLGYPGTSTTLGSLDLKVLNTQTGSPTTSADMFGNLSGDAVVTTAPTNPATFSEIGQAASAIMNLTVYDSLGASHNVTMAFFKTAANTWTAQSYIDGGEVQGGTAGVPVQLGADATLNFSSTGTIIEANRAAANITGQPTYANGAAAGNFAIDLSAFSQFAGATSQLSSVTQDGKGSGNVKSFEIRSDGKLVAILDSGTQVLVGSIPIATFRNLDGLERAGASTYQQGENAGERILAAPGEQGLGKLEGSSLERSTVDLATQFIDLVLYQRGYQANSQTLNAANGLIRDTIGLIR